MRYIVLIARFIIGVLFIYAATAKIPDPGGFAQSIRNYAIAPVEITNLAGMILPWIEILAGAALVLGLWIRPAALLTTAMLLVFASAATYAYLTGLDISCGCFGTGPESSGRVDVFSVLEKWGLAVLSFLILIFGPGPPGDSSKGLGQSR